MIIMNVFEVVKLIFNWFMSILVVLFLIFLIGFFAVVFYMLVSRLFGLFGSSSSLKRAITWILTIIFVVGMISLLIWAIPLAPKKDLLVITKELPRLDDPNNTSPAYLIYYVWDGKRQEIPWWIVCERPVSSGGYEWVVLEVANLDNIYDANNLIENVMVSARFDKSWFKNGMHRVQRTRAQKLRHQLFGGDIFEEEERILKQVLGLIESKETSEKK